MFFYEFGTLNGIILLGILVFFFIHVKRKEQDEKYKAEHPIGDTSEWHEKWEKRMKKEAEKAERRLDKSKILITKETFNNLVSETTKAAKLVNHFCYEPDFIDYCQKNRPETEFVENNGDDLFLHYEYALLDDILWTYDQLGCLYMIQDKCSINYDTAEGQCLFIIDEAIINIDEEDGYEYRFFQSAIDDPESLSYTAREMHKSIFETLTNYSPEKKQEEYQICTVLHDYNPKYERLYRLLMYRIATIVAEADGTPTFEEKQWLTKNALTETIESINLEQTIASFKPSKITYCNSDGSSNWYEEDDDEDCDLSASVTYTVLDAPEEDCDLDNLSNHDLRRLKTADENGEHLDSDYISEHMHSIHNKIIEAIKEDLESKSGDPHDGMVEVHHPPAYWGWEKVHASHQEMSLADEYEIEYTVDIY